MNARTHVGTRPVTIGDLTARPKGTVGLTPNTLEEQISQAALREQLGQGNWGRWDQNCRAATLHPELEGIDQLELQYVADEPRYALPAGFNEGASGLIRSETRVSPSWIRPTAIIRRPNGDLLREIALARPTEESQDDPEWERVIVRPEDIGTARVFNNALIRRGSHRFTGRDADLIDLLGNEYALPQYTEVPFYGRLLGTPSRGLVVGNAVIANNRVHALTGDSPRVELVDGTRLVITANEFVGHVPQPLDWATTENDSLVALRALLDGLIEIFGTVGAIALGFVVSSLAAPTVRFDRSRGFPHALLVGPRGSGKSTLADVMLAFFGLRRLRREAAQVTGAALLREMDRFPGLLLCLDDARPGFLNDNLANLLGAFDGAGGVRARTGDFRSVHAFRPGSALVLSTEAAPSDPALRSRCVTLTLDASRHTLERRTLVQELSARAALAAPAVLRTVGPDFDERLITLANQTANGLEIEETRARTDTWAWPLAGLYYLSEILGLDLHGEHESMIFDATLYAEGMAREDQSRTWADEFLADLAEMLADGSLREPHRFMRAFPEHAEVHLDVNRLHPQWVQARRARGQDRPLVGAQELGRELLSRGLLTPDRPRRKTRLQSQPRNVVVLNIPHDAEDARAEILELLRQ